MLGPKISHLSDCLSESPQHACDLCKHQQALTGKKLCPVCLDAIARLVRILGGELDSKAYGASTGSAA